MYIGHKNYRKIPIRLTDAHPLIKYLVERDFEKHKLYLPVPFVGCNGKENEIQSSYII
jgi:hypothetical protein